MQELNKEILIYFNSFLNYQVVEKVTLVFVDAPIFFLPIFLIVTWIYYTIKAKNYGSQIREVSQSDKEDFKLQVTSGKLKTKDYTEKKKDLLFVFYSCVIAMVINLIIKNFVIIDRPETALEGVGKLLLTHVPNASFPSDHAAVSVAFLIFLFFIKYKKTGLIFLIPVVLMSISRVILGIHWPFDILVGVIIGIISAIISFKFLKGNKYIDKFNNFVLKVAGIFKL